MGYDLQYKDDIDESVRNQDLISVWEKDQSIILVNNRHFTVDYNGIYNIRDKADIRHVNKLDIRILNALIQLIEEYKLKEQT